MSYLHFR